MSVPVLDASEKAIRSARNRIGGASKHGNEELAEASRREHAVLVAAAEVEKVAPVLTPDERAAYVEKIVEAAPPLTPEQVASLTAIIARRSVVA